MTGYTRRCCMADENKRKDIDSTTDDLAEAISFLQSFYKSIISYRLTKVNSFVRKVKVYPSLQLPPYQRKVKVYPSLPELPELERVRIIELPPNYIPTPFTEVRHVLDHEAYIYFYNMLTDELDEIIKDSGTYGELNNYKELFEAVEHSAITELYEKYFDREPTKRMMKALSKILKYTQQIMYDYRLDQAEELAWRNM